MRYIRHVKTKHAQPAPAHSSYNGARAARHPIKMTASAIEAWERWMLLVGGIVLLDIVQ